MSTCKNPDEKFVIENIELSDSLSHLKGRVNYVPTHATEVIASKFKGRVITINKVHANGAYVGAFIVARTRGFNVEQLNSDLAKMGGATEVDPSANGEFKRVKNNNSMFLYTLGESTMTDEQMREMAIPLHGRYSGTGEFNDDVIRSEGVLRVLEDMVMTEVSTITVDPEEMSLFDTIVAYTVERNLPVGAATKPLLLIKVNPSTVADCTQPIWSDVSKRWADTGLNMEDFIASIKFYDSSDNFNTTGVKFVVA